MRFTIVSMNVRHGALLTPHGAADDRWDPMASMIRALDPDVLALQETHTWADHNHQQLLRAEQSTGLRAVWTPPGTSTLLMYRPCLSLAQWEDRYAKERNEPGFPGIGVFRVAGVVSPLSIASVHLAPDSEVLAMQQAQRISWRCRRYLGPNGEGENGVFIGDVNQLPVEHPLDPPLPDPATLPAANLSGRWKGPPGAEVPNRDVAQMLARTRWADAAHLIADRTGRTDVLAPTGRGGWRVDQGWVTEGLVPAVVDFEHLDVPGTDHRGQRLVLDTTLIDANLVVTPNR